jgi:hypothetical protein
MSSCSRSTQFRVDHKIGPRKKKGREPLRVGNRGTLERSSSVRDANAFMKNTLVAVNVTCHESPKHYRATAIEKSGIVSATLDCAQASSSYEIDDSDVSFPDQAFACLATLISSRYSKMFWIVPSREFV